MKKSRLTCTSFDELLQKFVYSFRSTIPDCGNSLVVYGIAKSPAPLFSKIWAWWSDTAFTEPRVC